MKIQRITFLFAFLFCGVSLYAQNPFVANTNWATSKRIDNTFEEIKFRQIDSNDYSMDNYYQIHFLPNKKFYAHNIPACGLDCVVHVDGTYTTTDTTTQFTIHKILRFKTCSGDDTVTKDIGTYYLIQDEYSLRLVKNFSDEPKENYFKKLNIDISDFKDKEAIRILKKYEYQYNRIYQIVANKNDKKYSIVREETGNLTYQEAYKYASKKGDQEFRILATELNEKLEALYKQIEPKG